MMERLSSTQLIWIGMSFNYGDMELAFWKDLKTDMNQSIDSPFQNIFVRFVDRTMVGS